jgi:hypothetical protein
MAKENAAEIPQFERISQKEMQAIRDYVDGAVDDRVHQHLLNLPNTLSAMGIKLGHVETRKEKLIRVGTGVAIVGAAVLIGYGIQKLRERGEKQEEAEDETPAPQNRVRPVGRTQVTTSLNN